MPEMTVESLDLRTAVSYLGMAGDERSWERFDEYHRAALARVAAGGAQIAIVASNTPHCRFARITRGITIPVVNLFDAVAGACSRSGSRRALILGTSLTMNSPALPLALSRYGIKAFSPDRGLQRRVESAITALQQQQTAVSGEVICEIARRSHPEPFDRSTAVCLCCTELPLAFGSAGEAPLFEHEEISFVNSTAVHIEAAFAALMDESEDA